MTTKILSATVEKKLADIVCDLPQASQAQQAGDDK